MLQMKTVSTPSGAGFSAGKGRVVRVPFPLTGQIAPVVLKNRYTPRPVSQGIVKKRKCKKEMPSNPRSITCNPIRAREDA